MASAWSSTRGWAARPGSAIQSPAPAARRMSARQARRAIRRLPGKVVSVTRISAHGHRVADDPAIEIPLLIERDAEGLRGAAFVRGASQQPVLTRFRIPLEVPPDPRLTDVRLAQARGHPRRPVVPADHPVADLAIPRPRPSAEELPARAQLPFPRELEGALDVLEAQDWSLGRGLGLVVWSTEHLVVGVPGRVQPLP